MNAYRSDAEQKAGPDAAGSAESLPIAEFLLDSRAVMAAVETVIDGKREAVEIATTVLLAEGHLLVEDVPGVGKTMLAKAPAARRHHRRQHLQPGRPRVRVQAGPGVREHRHR
jgi:MoxR-like ATPase